MLKKFNRRGFVIATSEEEAVAVRQAIEEVLKVKADIVHLGPRHWFIYKAEVLDRWIESGILRRKDGKPIERL
jgi:hypothetical protein